jgi:AhpC/TSA family
MANNLTGDFDVVAEFAVLAVNRLLAGMHQTGRFLHSISVRVDDNPRPTRPPWPVVVGAVDAFGDAVANQRQIGSPNPFAGPAAVTSPIAARLGVLLNPDRLVAPPQIIPSHISGVAQLQLFPPTVAVPTVDGESLTVRLNLMSRFFPDKGTAALAEFMRGDLDITAPINNVVSGNINVLDIDFKADEATITFTPSYTSQALSLEDQAGINLCIQNGLQTSFLPSSVTLPNTIADVQLKTLPGALVLMLDLTNHASTTSSVTNVFMASTDDFAFAVGRDYLLNAFAQISNNIMSQTFKPVTFTVDLSVWGIGETLHYTYPIALTSVSFDLQPGKIVLTVQGNAGPEPNHDPHNFSFTVTVDLSLVPSGPSVELSVGNVSVSTSSTLAGILDFFTGDITNAVKDAIIVAIAATDTTVDNMFNADTNLGNFLNTQFAPVDGSSQTPSQNVFLVYNSVDIQQAGVVLHGSLILFDWPAPYVEFEPIPQKVSGPPGVIVQGTDYSALNTWIPGGTIGQYEWSVQGQEQAYPFDVDPNRFVLLHSPLANEQAASVANAAVVSVPGYSPLCLTITGFRISNYGSPPTYQPVTASVCGFLRFPIPLPGGVLTGRNADAAPMVAIARPKPSGALVVSAQTRVDLDQTGISAPNLMVHFADSKSFMQLQVLTEAVARSNRKDSPTAVVAVLTPEQLSKAPYTSGIVYAEDSDGSWESALGLKSAKPPLTLIVTPRGSIVWQKEGELEVSALAQALTQYLVKRPPVQLSLPHLNVRIGQPAPNFLFEYASGREMPLTKLFGQAIILVFWRSSVKASIQTVRDLQASAAKSRSPAVVMAVNDGEDPSVARAVAAESGLTAILVTDPKREISVGYGVSLWPTIVSIDSSGAVAGIKYGYVQREPVVPSPGSSPKPMGTSRRSR